jgi:uncharacterized protein (TIGR02246 family)
MFTAAVLLLIAANHTPGDEQPPHHADRADHRREVRMTRPPTTPESVIATFSAALQKGAVDDLVDLFEADAVLVPEPAAVPIVGLAAIREALGRFADLQPTMTNDIRHVVVAGDIAVVHNAWQLEGTGPDGAPVVMQGVSADVLRRRSDGGWAVLIDDPWGPSTGGAEPPLGRGRADPGG